LGFLKFWENKFFLSFWGKKSPRGPFFLGGKIPVKIKRKVLKQNWGGPNPFFFGKLKMAPGVFIPLGTLILKCLPLYNFFPKIKFKIIFFFKKLNLKIFPPQKFKKKKCFPIFSLGEKKFCF